MPLPLPVAALICSLLLALDLVARALRIHLFVRGAGHRARFRDVFVLNVFGDAASAVTPMRLGGEPARLLGLLRAGIPATVGVPLLAVEVTSYTAVVAGVAALAGWMLGPAWWAGVGPQLIAGLRSALPWIAAVIAVSIGAGLIAARMRRSAEPRPAAALRSLRGLLGWPLAASVPLTAVSVAARVGILPVLAQMLDQPPATEQLLLSSLALIYGQILLPTPAGLGAVEVAFASGVAGDLGGRLTTVFLMWRGFITLVPVLLGFGLAIPSYGGSTIRAVLRGRLPAAPRRDSEPLP